MSLNSVTISARHSTGLVETVYSGDPSSTGSFQGAYTSSTVNPVAAGYDWNIQRTGGWLGSSVELTIDAADGDGNHTVETIVWYLPVSGFAGDVLAIGTITGSNPLDPSVSPGAMAPVGAILPRSNTDQLWQKFGLADTDWRLVTVGITDSQAPGALTIPSGQYMLASGHLTLFSSQRIRLLGSGRLAIR